MIVSELWRYPVKSLGGERLDSCGITDLGLDGDRRWALLDKRTGKVLTAKRDGRLLAASSRCGVGGGVIVTLPDGRETEGSDDIAAWLDLDVELVPASAGGSMYENPKSFEDETDWVTWQGPGGAFHDVRLRVSIISTATLGSWDPRRFRSNVVVEGAGEDDLVGQTVDLGSAILTIEKRLVRCVVVTRAQPGLERDLDLLRTVNAQRQSCLAVGAVVESGGRVMVGDRLQARAA